MTDGPSDQEKIAAADRMSEMLRGVRDELARLNRYGRRNRKLVLFDIAATVIAIISTVIALHANADAGQAQRRADRAYARIVAAHESQIGACQVGNQIRREQVQFWQYLASLSLSKPAPHLTARQLAKNKHDIAAILAHSRKSFPQLNCQALYRLPKGG